MRDALAATGALRAMDIAAAAIGAGATKTKAAAIRTIAKSAAAVVAVRPVATAAAVVVGLVAFPVIVGAHPVGSIESLLAACGKPSHASEGPPPRNEGILLKQITHSRARVRAVFIASTRPGAARAPLWKLIGFEDTDSGRLLSDEELERRLPCAFVHAQP